MRLVPTTNFHRGKLPHWEVKGGRYFITVRQADSLPIEIIRQLQEVHLTLSAITPQSEQFIDVQRRYFRMLEKHLSAGTGSCVLREPRFASILVEELASLQEWEVAVSHYSIMPNHWHAIIEPSDRCVHSLGSIMKRVKGRSAKFIRARTEAKGPLWQREWFDRWMRDPAEYEKTVAYIRQNPVEAGIVGRREDHPWTR